MYYATVDAPPTIKEMVEMVAEKYDLELPLTDQVYAILYEGRDPREALQALMSRDLRSES
jgi:glycerol-3-phosphate dehydrogenase (NAD(P)+)